MGSWEHCSVPDAEDHENTHDGPKPVPLHDPERLLDDMSKAYYAIVDIVSGFDQRLMTIKGWSVTISLAALGLAFQQGHYSLFALAAVTGVAFRIVDALTKRRQMRYYGRMSGIEAAAFQLDNVRLNSGIILSAPTNRLDLGFPGKPGERD
jgi:hypothetical protein